MSLDCSKLFLYMFGTCDMEYIIAGAVFMLLGAVASIGLNIRKGIKQNQNSPDKFSIKYLLNDKAVAFIHGLLFSVLALRFSAEWFGNEPTLALAALYGFINYRFANIIMKLVDKYFPKTKNGE